MTVQDATVKTQRSDRVSMGEPDGRGLEGARATVIN